MTSVFVDLYINGLPVNYSIAFNQNAFEFEPIFNPHDDLDAPFFLLREDGENWIMIGADDHSIKYQALEYLNNYSTLGESDNWAVLRLSSI